MYGLNYGFNMNKILDLTTKMQNDKIKKWSNHDIVLLVYQKKKLQNYEN